MQYVYLLREGQDYYKVGISHNVKSRVSQLQQYVPNKIEIICTKFMDVKAYETEQELHEFLEEHKTDGANEWFKLTPEDALKLCVRINNYPDIDISERVTLATIANNVKRNQRLIEKKLDHVLNTYQKDLKNLANIATNEITAEKPKVEVVDKKAEKEREDRMLFDQAKELVILEEKASTSLLQRKLRIGYGRAARLVEELEQHGVIGPADGSRPRVVFL